MEFSFPARIQSLCEEKGISPDDLRKQGSIAPRTWRGLMSGKTRNPSLRTVLKICRALGFFHPSFSAHPPAIPDEGDGVAAKNIPE